MYIIHLNIALETLCWFLSLATLQRETKVFMQVLVNFPDYFLYYYFEFCI